MSDPKIAILLSTFNGERWLPALMRSLVDQSLPFELIWRDDGSSDNTISLVRDFGWQKITQLTHSPPGENVGAPESFSRLMQAGLSSDAKIFFFADQDDIWRRDKLRVLSKSFDFVDDDHPLLVHHDLRVIREDGAEISSSLWRYMSLSPDATELRHYLTRNSVTGCASAFNRGLLNLSYPVPAEANMHDWWMALVASALGDIETINLPLVDYRQHDSNALGAKGLFSGLNPRKNWLAGWRRGDSEYKSLFSQALALEQGLADRLDQQDRALLARFLALPHMPLFKRLRTAHQLGLRDRNTILWVVGMLRVLLNPKG